MVNVMLQKSVVYLRTLETAWHTSETGVTTAAMVPVKNSHLVDVAEIRTTSAQEKNVKDFATELVSSDVIALSIQTKKRSLNSQALLKQKNNFVFSVGYILGHFGWFGKQKGSCSTESC